ncbi:SpoIID/LytB domain-containing protein [uncultured Phascolarctobacterium sp.]|uniref:SpoIID/LytB domain-containing protein n=1 Tax=uncultured Phascolarctobacterium sp. TaxID=512296 RepID=UPI0025CD57A2|nr:SpoIID/LytB domain-containing protein [uncultured Phascolarctobacterium sp.]
MLRKLLILSVLLFTFIFASAAAAAEQIRIGIVVGQATAELSCEDEFTVRDSAGKTTTMPKGKYFIHVQQGKLFFDDNNEFGNEAFVAAAAGKRSPQINKRSYKGDFQLRAEQGDKLLVVNRLPLENYLASVLPAKTMVVWPDEVIKAQAVAARSYAMHKMEQSKNAYALLATDKELPYEGTGKRIEKSAVTKLIQATKGQYLADAYGRAIEAVTTSSTGGRTESALNLWGTPVSYLQSVEDYDSDSPEYTWERRVSPAFLEGLLAQRGYAAGKLTSIRLSPLDDAGVDRTPTGRVKYIILSGEAATVKISGDELVELLGLNSALFELETGTPVPETLKVPIEDYYGMEIGSKDIDIKVNESKKPVWKNLVRSYHLLGGGKEEKIIFHGKGKGSGLGLSAWGARGLANADAKATYKTILAHYYPGAKLVR